MLSRLLAKLQSEDWFERKTAVEELQQLKDQRAVGPLLQMLAKEKDEDVCLAIVCALGALGNRRAAEPLRHIARSHHNSLLRELAIASLAQLLDSQSIEIFMEQGWKAYNPEVRVAVARALGELKVTAAAPQLVSMLEDEEQQVRLAATEALIQINGPAVLEEIRWRLNREILSSGAISHAVVVLEHNGSRQAAELLCMLLTQPDPYTGWLDTEQRFRRRIAKALGRIVGRSEAIEILLHNASALAKEPSGIAMGILEEVGARDLSQRMRRFLALLLKYPEVKKNPEIQRKIIAAVHSSPAMER